MTEARKKAIKEETKYTLWLWYVEIGAIIFAYILLFLSCGCVWGLVMLFNFLFGGHL